MPKQFALLVGMTTLAACSHGFIRGTHVEDTRDNHQLYDIIEDVRAAMELRDSNRVLAHVSPQYFEDMGTPEPVDDYGYDQLKEILPQSFAATKEIHVILEVHAIVVEDEKAYADIRYASRARIELPSGGSWDSHREFNRIEFAKEKGDWMIISGL